MLYVYIYLINVNIIMFYVSTGFHNCESFLGH